MENTSRILVVDDSEQNLLLVELYLRGTGFVLDTVQSGPEALDSLSKRDYDLILLDVVMPEMGGLELCERIKANPRTQHVPVIFLTARVQSEADRLQAFAVGAVDYISKPIQRNELIARIRAMLRTHEVTRRLEIENRELAEEARGLRRYSETLLEERELLAALARERERGVVSAVLVGPDQVALDAWPCIDRVLGVARAELVGTKLADHLLLVEPMEWADQDQEGFGPGARRRVDDVAVSIRWASRPAEDVAAERWLLLRLSPEASVLEKRLDGRQLHHVRQSDNGSSYRIAGFCGESCALEDLTRQVELLRERFVTTLIHGESGTGKELVARALHFDGPFADRPFIPIHCGAIAPELIESELFGHEKGSFTGAQTSKPGLFQAADGGTVFLDEIAETPQSLQVKLLRVLQEGEVRPVGATKAQRVDVRIIAATNGDLRQMVDEGTFREDLFYRLDVAALSVPPLRDRVDDIELLVEAFTRQLNDRHRPKERVLGITKGALAAMRRYSWPGNVRELENVIARAFALGATGAIDERDLPPHVIRGEPRTRWRGSRTVGGGPQGAGIVPPTPASEGVPPAVSGGLHEQRAEIDRAVLEAALRRNRGDRRATWLELDIGRSTFYRYLKRFQIDPDEYRTNGEQGAES